MKQKYKWRLTRINDGFEMTRINGQAIECRGLSHFEKIFYIKNYVKLRRGNKCQIKN